MIPFTLAEQAAQKVLSLPIYPELSTDQITYVAEAIKLGVKSVVTSQADSPRLGHTERAEQMLLPIDYKE